ncbi:30S ribosomal protein S12 methylthiotransferase RimO [Youxingia wuxianensis]|uniref:Ribosomal protein uS12 methylthiotransferase RimO n=1 Tax=Youxingia wuxianensis TaxID=2763678 RepID=A0A926IG78_9FIRM|nr:30S ribosomal protein S12 methylthiotransferase RimO [Youxingia wuxianensis]MBC8584594.1 30S ribosomal protein S12 methylthiotransferase RimO [Youxingia wuxianensis]
MAIKVGMVSLGCSKNQVDAEIMLALLKKGGYTLCADERQCDVVIINTCGFIEDAKRESIENILEFCRLKEKGKLKVVAVTGCLAERYRQEVASEIPEADVVLGIGRNADIAEAIHKALHGEKVVEFGKKEDLPLEGERVISNLPFFAYLKVADGCDNRCSYCAIPLIRGNFRSRPMEKVLEEARQLAEQGVTELNVVAQDTTRYGEDLYGRLMLAPLLEELCKIEKIRWIRVLYCYPDRITDQLLEVMANNEKIVKYMDIPIQHVSGRLLGLMNRQGDMQSLTALMENIRAKVPGVILRTTLITGFPTESEEDFEELIRFIKKVKFERLGCFAYSAEEDTPAAEMDGQIDEELKKHRAQIVMEEQYGIMEAFNRSMLGKQLWVAVEGFDGETYYGRSYMDAPDIDTKVFFTSSRPLKTGEYVLVTINGVQEYDLAGKASI